MKRIVASVSLVALGTSVLNAAEAGALSAMQTSKPWFVSASLRGFYDDNINSTKNNKQDAFGFEVSPSVGIAVAGERTSASASYTYSGKYYTEKPAGNTTYWDHTHIFDAAVQHAFSERNRLVVADSFVIGQEPDVMRIENGSITPQRISGDNMRNYGSIIFTTQTTELLGFEVGYANSWYDYDDEGAALAAGPGGTVAVVQASRSGILDRMEHSAHIDSRWHFAPQTVGILGYMYSQTDFQGDEFIQGSNIPPIAPGTPPLAESDSRNSRSHFVYLGVEHSFNPDLSGSLRVGAQYVDFYHSDTTSLSPYAQGSLRYMYATESHLELGGSYRRSTTDFVGSTSVVTDADTGIVYLSVVQRILPRLFGSAVATFQNQTFNGGGPGADNQNDRFYLLGLDLAYRFSAHLSAHCGYNLDLLDSEISARDFTRNRFYVGVTAEY